MKHIQIRVELGLRIGLGRPRLAGISRFHPIQLNDLDSFGIKKNGQQQYLHL
jgi:hypothetical protein